jgi:hypothetical protein
MVLLVGQVFNLSVRFLVGGGQVENLSYQILRSVFA